MCYYGIAIMVCANMVLVFFRTVLRFSELLYAPFKLCYGELISYTDFVAMKTLSNCKRLLAVQTKKCIVCCEHSGSLWPSPHLQSLLSGSLTIGQVVAAI